MLLQMMASGKSTPLDSSLDASWKKWKTTYKKEYKTPAEEASRRAIWEENLKIIERHNQEYKKGLQTCELGMNQFGDMAPNEVGRGGLLGSCGQ
ncbi:protein CTLA-2-beta-like isoform 1-T1 [Clarias gariepinus]